MGRTISETATLPGMSAVTFTQAFDAASRRTSLKARIDTTDDFENSYTWDSLSRLTKIEQQGQSGGATVAEKRVDFTYNAAHQFTNIKRYKDTDGQAGNLVAQSNYTYDGIGRLTGLAHVNGGTTIADYAWQFDAASRITQHTFSHLVGGSGTSTYSYDNTDQVTAADHTNQSDENYSYDRAGNRTNAGYNTTTNNQLQSDGTYTYLYDNEGNRTRRTNIASGARTDYQWDYRNRLTRVTELTDQGALTRDTVFEYDAFDRRVKRHEVAPVADGPVQHYYYDPASAGDGQAEGSRIVLRLSETQSGTTIERYLHGPAVDQVLADENVQGVVRWGLADNLGTVRDVVNNADTVVNHLVYNAYGKVTSETDTTVKFLYGLTGRERDEETGLNYHRARWYDPGVGRWIAEDPIGFEGGDPSLVRYVGNAPENSRDPAGLEEEAGEAGAEQDEGGWWAGWSNFWSGLMKPLRGSDEGDALARVNRALDKSAAGEGKMIAGIGSIGDAAFENAETIEEDMEVAGLVVETGARMVCDELDNTMTAKEIAEDPTNVSNLAAALPILPGSGKKIGRVIRKMAKRGEKVSESGKVLRAAERIEKSAAKAPTNVARVIQDHHAIPWNNKTWNHQKHPLVKQAGNPDLEKLPQNLRALEGHAGRHSASYHQEIRRRMDEALKRTAGKGKEAAQKELDTVITGVWDDIATGKLKPNDHKDVILPP